MHAQVVPYLLNVELFDQLTTAKGWKNDRQRAIGIGVSHTTVGRNRRREVSPSAEFILKATAALDVSVEQLFKTPVGAL